MPSRFARERRTLVALSLFALLITGTAQTRAAVREEAATAVSLTRPADPVVVPGSGAPRLLGAAPNAVVAYRYAGGWQQIPVQVDERDTVDFGTIYHGPAIGVTSLVYTDATTWTGPDSNATLDSNDEVVFMARDAGGRAPAGGADPAGVVPASGVEVRVTDALVPSAEGYVYLFRWPGAAPQPASYVTYTFALLSGNYKLTYNLTNGPNPENTTISTSYYRQHFSDRWISDQLRVLPSQTDLLDRDKVLFMPGNCDRSEDTFCGIGLPGGADSNGAFIANKNGPVRAIRSYIGANSGVLTQRDHFFYESREDVVTTLRVHPIPGVMSFFDFSPTLVNQSLSYTSKTRQGQIQTAIVDGNSDTVQPGDLQWEMVQGSGALGSAKQGTVVRSTELATDITGLVVTSYYEDNRTSPSTQCTGDAFAYGSSGIWIQPGALPSIPCTDPRGGAGVPGCATVSHLALTVHIGFEKGGIPFTANDAQALRDRAVQPLRASEAAWPPQPGDTVGVYDPAAGGWYLKNQNAGGSADFVFVFGAGGSGLSPLKGDWDGNGTDTPGLYSTATGGFLLRNSNDPGTADLGFTFGAGGLGSVGLSGDWNGDGIDTIGLYQPSTGTFFLKNSNASGTADVSFTFGSVGQGFVPVTGDWNGDGVDTIGLYQPSTGVFFLRNTNASGAADTTVIYGPAGQGFVPVTGDWDENLTDTIGLYQPSTGAFFLKNANTPGVADVVFNFGAPGFVPLAGNWDGE